MDKRIKQILDYIEENLSEALSLDELASMACISPSQFHRVFKHETGRTPFKFMEEIKMNKAHQELMNGEVMVHELAFKMGYNDYETFSRAFKKYFDLSPDDLKAIVAKIRENFGSDRSTDEDEIVIATFDHEYTEKEVMEKLENIIQEKNLSITELEKSTFFKISQKTSNESNPKNVIKNKYEISTGGKIWESLINKQ